MKNNIYKMGLTIIEIVLVIAIISILGAVTIGYFKGQISEVSLESTSKTILSDLNSAKQRAMAGDRGVAWGVRIKVNNPSTWMIFASSSQGDFEEYVGDVNVLPPGLEWKDPITGTKEIYFNPISGESNGGQIILSYGNNSIQISVVKEGVISSKRI